MKPGYIEFGCSERGDTERAANCVTRLRSQFLAELADIVLQYRSVEKRRAQCSGE